jgi:hypothetical protein
MHVEGHEGWDGLLTVDNNRDHKPDWVWNLMHLPTPFENDSVDEIHAYEVLEHTGRQGDYEFFFAQFSDFYRILKPNGLLFATVPAMDSVWALGDPSHTRIVQPENLIFLHQPAYTEQIGKTSMSDFRYLYKADFDIMHLEKSGDNLRFVLKAIKPSRISI